MQNYNDWHGKRFTLNIFVVTDQAPRGRVIIELK